MMIGSEKMLLSLGIKADKTRDKALTLNDVEVLNISVKKSWNSKSIVDNFSETEKKMGRSPIYIISDNAYTLCKGIRDKFFTHVRDVSHTLAMFVERQYKHDSAFQAFIKDVSAVKFKEIMRFASYLLPPKQRTIARFMNLSGIIEWAKKVLRVFPILTEGEQQIFGFLHKHTPLITELGALFDQINHISKRLKTEGLSKETVSTSIADLQSLLLCGNPRIQMVAKESIQYLQEEGDKLTDEKTIWHVSSDVIESVFGNYKIRKSPNSLNGVTRYVMILPLLTAINTKTGTSNICFKSALESVFLKDLKQWSDDNLTENMTVKRRKTLNVA
ncbi:MAG: hypothetical protein LBT24_03865, partial [Tannerella sp.]|nr:hypothetical protein [Tannerella sp.]